MARHAEPIAAKDTVRIVVLTTDTSPGGPEDGRAPHELDVSVVTSATLADTAILIARQFDEALSAQKVNTDWLTSPGSALELGPLVGDGWDQTRTLGEVGVVNGDKIVLTTKEANERFPRLIESMADAAAHFRNSHFRSWDAAASHGFAAATLPPAAGLIGLIGAGAALRHPGLIQWVIVAALAVAATIVSLAAVSTAQYRQSSPATPALGLAMHALLGATAAAAVPSDGWGMWNIAAAAVVVTASSAGMVSLQAPKVWAHIAVFTGMLAVTLGASISLLYSLWRTVTTEGIAAVVATCAFLIFMANVPLARRFARLDMPVLPDLGEDVDMRQTHNLAAMAREISDGDRWASLIHSEDRNVAARYASLGIMVGTGSVASISAVVAGASIYDTTLRLVVPEIDGRWVGALTFAVLCALFILRGTWNTDRGLCTAGIISGAGVGLGYIAGVVLFGSDDSVVRVVGLVVGALAIILLASLALFRATDNPPTEKRVKAFQMLETVLMVLVLTDALTMLNVFFSVRGR